MGRIHGAHGVRGSLMVASFCEPPGRLLDFKTWWLRRDDGAQAVKLLRGSVSTKGLIADLEGISDRDTAAALKGVEIAVDRQLLPALRKQQYYWADLEGLQVLNQDGVDFGRVDHLFSNGAHPILVVRDGERERLIPFVMDHHVLSVDLDAGRIQVDWDADF
ncbi:MAG: ribosome maturation factor RimM [Xanthomonadales bacterium]|nr:ribosome maturation factor RimM [Xanthomonadales bacterium]